MTRVYDYLVVGAGVYGSTVARLLTDAGKKVLVIERKAHIAGMCFDELVDGIRVNRYGGHIFHTNSKAVWDFVQRFAVWKPYYHKVFADYKGTVYTLPINFMTIQQVYGVYPKNGHKLKGEGDNLRAYAVSLLGERLYKIFIEGYTYKQWGVDPELLPASIIKRLPVHQYWGNDYFTDKYQALPQKGFTEFVCTMLKGVDVYTNIDYLTDMPYWNRQAREVVYTGALDEYYKYDMGVLPYRALRHEHQRLEHGSKVYCATMNYTDVEVPYTRIMEWKYFDNRPPKVEHSIYTLEYSLPHKPGVTEPFYPINTTDNQALYKKYTSRIAIADWLHVGGRLGAYQYYNIDQAIAAAMRLVERLAK